MVFAIRTGSRVRSLGREIQESQNPHPSKNEECGTRKIKGSTGRRLRRPPASYPSCLRRGKRGQATKASSRKPPIGRLAFPGKPRTNAKPTLRVDPGLRATGRGDRRAGAEILRRSPQRPISARGFARGAEIGLLATQNDTGRGWGAIWRRATSRLPPSSVTSTVKSSALQWEQPVEALCELHGCGIVTQILRCVAANAAAPPLRMTPRLRKRVGPAATRSPLAGTRLLPGHAKTSPPEHRHIGAN
jgi:hypothetical protein